MVPFKDEENRAQNLQDLAEISPTLRSLPGLLRLSLLLVPAILTTRWPSNSLVGRPISRDHSALKSRYFL